MNLVVGLSDEIPNLTTTRVLYADIAEGRESLQSLFDKLKDRIEKGNVAPWGLSSRPFKPHMTLFKVRCRICLHSHYSRPGGIHAT